MCKGKCKGKIHLRTGHEGPEEELYSFFKLGTRVIGCSTPRPGRFNPGKDPVPIVQEARRASEPVWTM